jgi:hypothetical protein
MNQVRIIVRQLQRDRPAGRLACHMSTVKTQMLQQPGGIRGMLYERDRHWPARASTLPALMIRDHGIVIDENVFTEQ